MLDQGEQLMAWDDFDQIAAKETKAHSAFITTVRTVLRIRTDFYSFLNGFNEDHDSGELSNIKESNPELFERLEKSRLCNIKSQSFSDTNIWYTNTAGEDNRFLCKSAYLLMSGIGLIHLRALSREEPCRGGIDLGVGTDAVGMSGMDEIYGPALLKAYTLESKISQYPRVTVGDSVLGYLNGRYWEADDFPNDEPWSSIADYENHYINSLRNMIAIDDDGACIIDYAGKFASIRYKHVLQLNNEHPAEVFSHALEFSKNSYKRFAQKRNFYLAERYSRLTRYLESRKQFWGDSP